MTNALYIYLDDILVVGRTLEDHLNNLREVFSHLQQSGLNLKPSKYRIAKREVTYLGYVVSNQGIAPDPSRIAAVYDFLTPSGMKELQSFLGLVSYYNFFVPSFKIASPLFTFTRKDCKSMWDLRSVQMLSNQLKSLLTNASLLTFSDFEKDFILKTMHLDWAWVQF